MIASPFLSVSGNSDRGAAPPPPQFIHYLPQGAVQNAWRSAERPFAGSRSRKSGAQKAGLAYQKKVVKWAFESNHGFALEVSPWFAFTDDSDSRHYCQPDLLFISGFSILVAEVKLRWTADAWWQLRKLYLPVLAKVFPKHDLRALCICKSFDPAVKFPEPIELHSALANCSHSSFNVVIL